MTGQMNLAEIGLDVSRETMEDLRLFQEQLLRWTVRINLISRATTAQVWQRHILDSAQLWPLLPTSARRIADLGSGGGLPALVLAIIAKHQRPEQHFTLIESDGRKTAFLHTVITSLDLNATAINARIEEVQPARAEIVTARALAPLADLLPMAHRHLVPGGKCLLMKGRTHEAELRKALEGNRFSAIKHPSQTDAEAVILEIGDLTP